MAIDGLSQSSGVERLLEVSQADGRVLFVIRDRTGNVERERIVLDADDLLNTIAEPPKGGRSISDHSPGGTRTLDIDVRRNEVLLCVRPDDGEGCDIAVGLDDLTDALAEALPPA